MSSTTTAPASLEETLHALSSAELAIFLKPLDAFLTALQEPGVNTETLVQDYAKLQLDSLNNVPLAESTGINVTAAGAQAQLNAIVAKAAVPVA